MKNYPTIREMAKEIELYPVGDIHIGAPTSRGNEVLEFIHNAPDNARFVFMGDIIDNALTTSVSDTYSQTCPPEDALTKGFKQLIEAGKGKVIAAVGGNHEERTTRAVGIDLTRLLCEQYHILYSPDILVFGLQISPAGSKVAAYSIVVAHGRGGGRTSGGGVNAAERLKDVYPTGDVYITGHVHKPFNWKTSYFDIDEHNKKIMKRYRYHIIIPPWLGYEHYAANRFYPPSAEESVKIILNGDHHHKQVRIEVI